MRTTAPARHAAQALRSRVLTPVARALLLLACAALPVAAQEGAEPETVPLRGQVVDLSTGRPLAGAVVEIEEPRLRTFTDEEGRFDFRKVPRAEHDVVVSLLGYEELSRRVDAAAAGVVRLALRPDPVVLEELVVKMDLLERRRNRVAVASRAFDREEIRSSTAVNVEAFVRGRGGAAIVSCSAAFADACVWSRGSYVPVTVFLDEMPIYSIAHLAALQPAEVERIEVFQNGRHVRVYTSWFMEQVARGKRHLYPFYSN